MVDSTTSGNVVVLIGSNAAASAGASGEAATVDCTETTAEAVVSGPTKTAAGGAGTRTTELATGATAEVVTTDLG